MFRPRFFETIKHYSREQFIADLIAGVIVGIVAIPLAIAFAIASGVGPEKGIYTAIIAGFIISFLGGSNVQIGGPTGAFIVIVYGIIMKYGLDGLIIATIIAGMLLILMGLARLGSVIKYIPYPVIVGFTSGIALIIFSSQINDLFGLGITAIPGDFLGKWHTYLTHFSHINIWSLLIGGGTVLIIILWQMVNKKIPGALVALLVATAAVTLFKIPVETIGTRFGGIPSSLPAPHFPVITLTRIQELIPPSITIALLAGIESLLSAVVADGMIGKKHNSNTELIAQGLANIASGLFGGIPATGAIARTATNVKNGGRTPVAGMVHACVLLLILLFFGRLAALIPMSCLAGILVIVAYNMSEWRSFRAILKCPKSDVLVLVTTFALTVLLDLTVAIQVGIVLALLLFMRRMSVVANVNVIRDEFIEEKELHDPLAVTRIDIPEGVEIYEIDGPFFFGAAEKFKEEMLRMGDLPRVRILRMRHVPAIDSSGVRLLEDIYKDSVKRGTLLILSGIHSQPYEVLKKTGLDQLIGTDNIKKDIHDALNRAKTLLGINSPTLAEKIRRGGIYTIKGSNSLEIIDNAVKAFILPQKSDRQPLLNALIEREEMMGTGVGNGLAFPHPRNPVLHRESDEFIAIAYLEEPVDFGGPDGTLTKTALFVVSATSKSHLENLAQISKLCADPEFVKLLETRSSLDQILEAVEKHKTI